ncbi:ribonucleotide-diphosphate reductase subunit beta [Klebsiella pneumoniae]|uniref:Ribonucleotide-diphosphate reductase subunit beta n=1 Tax=Klebsiella pneumoniae TaxID=573 RepID=A0A377V6L8_KLEPN|nr:ribonucleotide-diphosphate reductase subunit beta [Klebsiella pneumoniae]
MWALLPLISIPELETWVETWAFSETIHSRSYTHIIRNIVNDPATVFDDIVTNEQIQKRAEGISHYYDSLIEMTSYWHLLGEGTPHRQRQNRDRESARAEKETLSVPDER